LTSTTKPADDFTNSDPNTCPVTLTLEKTDGNALDGGLENIISLDEDGKISINESNYDGASISVRVKGINGFNEAVYKAITITEKCGR
jgi:hypothetical protein